MSNLASNSDEDKKNWLVVAIVAITSILALQLIIQQFRHRVKQKRITVSPSNDAQPLKQTSGTLPRSGHTIASKATVASERLMESPVGPYEEIALHENDPLLKFLAKKKRPSQLAVYFLAVLLNLIFIFGVGSIVSYKIHPTANIVRVFDPDHLYFALALTFLFFPLITLLYVWQPLEVIETLNSLWKNNTILELQEGELSTFIRKMKGNIDSSRLRWLLLLIVVIFVLLQGLVVYPREMRLRGISNFWFHDQNYFWFVFMPLQGIMYYVVAAVAIKRLLALLWLNRLFRNFKALVHPLHPDGAGGLGALGNLAIKYSWIAVSIGAIAATVTIVRIVIGAGWIHLDLLILFALYIALVPIFLIIPLWSAHEAMANARNEVLIEVSSEFEKTILRQENVEVKSDSEIAEKLKELKARYELIKETYPTWPISLAVLRRFSITASLPLVTAIISVVIDVLVAYSIAL